MHVMCGVHVCSDLYVLSQIVFGMSLESERTQQGVERNTGDERRDVPIAMTTLGKLHEFNPDTEPFSANVEQVNIFFAANSIDDTKKVP